MNKIDGLVEQYADPIDEGMVKDIFKNIGKLAAKKLTGIALQKAGEMVIKGIEKQRSNPTEFYAYASQVLDDKDFDNIKAAVEFYLTKHQNKDAEKLVQLMSAGRS